MRGSTTTRLRMGLGPFAAALLCACASDPQKPVRPALVIEDAGSLFTSIETAPEAMDAEDLGISQASELVSAAGSGDIAEVKRLIAGGVDVNERNTRGTTALMSGAFYGHLEIVQALLEAGANPDARSFMSWPLASAMFEDHVSIVEALLLGGADTELTDNKGRTALMVAARDGQFEIAGLLVEHGADIEAVSIEEPPRNALLHALRTGNISIAELLLKAGARSEMPDGSEGSAFDVARKAHAALAEFLKQSER